MDDICSDVDNLDLPKEALNLHIEDFEVKVGETFKSSSFETVQDAG